MRARSPTHRWSLVVGRWSLVVGRWSLVVGAVVWPLYHLARCVISSHPCRSQTPPHVQPAQHAKHSAPTHITPMPHPDGTHHDDVIRGGVPFYTQPPQGVVLPPTLAPSATLVRSTSPTVMLLSRVLCGHISQDAAVATHTALVTPHGDQRVHQYRVHSVARWSPTAACTEVTPLEAHRVYPQYVVHVDRGGASGQRDWMK